MKIAIFIRVFAYSYPLLYGNKQKILFSCIKNEKFRTNSIDLRLYYVLSSIQFKYKILTNKIRLDCGTVLRSGRFLTHRHVSC